MKGCCVASRRIILHLTVSAMMAATALPALAHTGDVTHTGDLIKGVSLRARAHRPRPRERRQRYARGCYEL
jgi:hypothetical protein